MHTIEHIHQRLAEDWGFLILLVRQELAGISGWERNHFQFIGAIVMSALAQKGMLRDGQVRGFEVCVP